MNKDPVVLSSVDVDSLQNALDAFRVSWGGGVGGVGGVACEQLMAGVGVIHERDRCTAFGPCRGLLCGFVIRHSKKCHWPCTSKPSQRTAMTGTGLRGAVIGSD